MQGWLHYTAFSLARSSSILELPGSLALALSSATFLRARGLSNSHKLSNSLSGPPSLAQTSRLRRRSQSTQKGRAETSDFRLSVASAVFRSNELHTANGGDPSVRYALCASRMQNNVSTRSPADGSGPAHATGDPTPGDGGSQAQSTA